MMELVEFLRQRLAEDAAVVARNSGKKGLGDDGCFPDYRTYSDEDTAAADEYLDRFRPARVLREVESKRRIVDEHPVTDGVLGPCCRTCGELEQGGGIDGELPCPTLRLLALPYADHPDYQESWKP